MNSDAAASLIAEELGKIYPVKQYGENICFVNKKNIPFRLLCFSRRQLSFVLEYATEDGDAEVGRFENGDRFYFEDYSSVQEMVKAMCLEIDDE